MMLFEPLSEVRERAKNGKNPIDDPPPYDFSGFVDGWFWLSDCSNRAHFYATLIDLGEI
jgi:hypothetical protein